MKDLIEALNRAHKLDEESSNISKYNSFVICGDDRATIADMRADGDVTRVSKLGDGNVIIFGTSFDMSYSWQDVAKYLGITPDTAKNLYLNTDETVKHTKLIKDLKQCVNKNEAHELDNGVVTKISESSKQTKIERPKGYKGSVGGYLSVDRYGLWVSSKLHSGGVQISSANYEWIKDNFTLKELPEEEYKTMWGRGVVYKIEKKELNEAKTGQEYKGYILCYGCHDTDRWYIKNSNGKFVGVKSGYSSEPEARKAIDEMTQS